MIWKFSLNFTLFCLIFRISAESLKDLVEIERILYKRDALENTLRDIPKSKCRNGGIWAGGQCHCIHPHTGADCQDFACVHGTSVGHRFDPNSLFFSRPCICDQGWSGDMCEFHVTERCNQRGEWKPNEASGKLQCQCIGHYFGDQCQYTSRCDFGIIKNGRCICNKNYEGDYCERAACSHGYLDIKNSSRSCVCPEKYKGIHCDQCAQVGKYIQPYPECTVDFKSNHDKKGIRKMAKKQNKSRIFIISGAVVFLVIVAGFMIFLHFWTQRKKNPVEEAIRLEALKERQQMLTKAALKANEPESAQTTITKKEHRRRSLPIFIKFKRSSSTDRVLRVREPSGNQLRDTRLTEE